MPTFAYRALQANGKIAEGAIDAAGRPDALRQITALGLRPVNVTEKAGAAKKNTGETPGHISFKFESKRVSAKELENFTRLLSSLLAAGVPLSRALVILQKEASSAASKAQWKSIHDQVVDGLSLADAMAKSPETFPRVYIAMVEAGEAGGFLDVVLAQIAEFQAREKDPQVEGAHRHVVSLYFAGAGAGHPDLVADVFHSKISDHLQQHAHFAALDHGSNH